MEKNKEDNPSYYAILTAEVRYDKRLTPNAKLLYAEIIALANQKGFCWSSNSYFAELYGVSTTSISKWVSQLIEFKYLKREIVYKKGTKEVSNRYLTLVTHPPQEKLKTPPRKVNHPPQEKLKDNTTLNTTYNNKGENDDVDVYESFKQEIYEENPTMWFTTFYRRFKLKDKVLSVVMDDFIDHCKCRADPPPKTLKDFKNHFYNWCNRVDPIGKLDRYKKGKKQGAL